LAPAYEQAEPLTLMGISSLISTNQEHVTKSVQHRSEKMNPEFSVEEVDRFPEIAP